MIFDFCPNSRVAEELPPEEVVAASMNGWDFTAKPKIPYRAKFKVTLYGMRWYLDGAELDTITDAEHNMGRLRTFYLLHRTWDTFTYEHEYLGDLTVRFDKPLNFPAAIPNSDGRIEPLELTLIHHNPSF